MTAAANPADAPERMHPPILGLAAFFVVVQFYTSFAVLAPTPPVGYDFAGVGAASALVGILVLAGAWCGVSLARERRLFGRSASHVILGAWLASAGISTVLGLDPLSGAQVVGLMLVSAGFHLALVRWFGAAGVVRAVLVPFLWAGSLAAAGGIVMVLIRRPAALWAYNHGRAAGFFVTANQFAAFLIAFLFVALGCALAMRGWPQRLGAIASALALAALFATVSVAGLLGAIAGGIYYAASLGARRVAIALGVVAVLGGIAIGVRPVAAHDPADRFDRLRTWQAGARVVALFPATGVGPMAYWRVYPAVAPPNGAPPGTFGALHPHDAYLSLAGETGVLGLAALGWGAIVFVRTVRVRLRARTKPERRFVLAVCAALVAVLVQGLFDTVGIVEMTFVWIPYTALALGAAIHGLDVGPAKRPGVGGRTTRVPAEDWA